MAVVDGWVMARKPGAIPFTIFHREWLALPSVEDGRRDEAAFRAAVRGNDWLKP